MISTLSALLNPDAKTKHVICQVTLAVITNSRAKSADKLATIGVGMRIHIVRNPGLAELGTAAIPGLSQTVGVKQYSVAPV